MPKRCFDLLCALILSVLTLPVLLLCALLIKLDSPGPVLFRQWRMGRWWRPFRLLKLRTMEHLSSGSAVTLGADPRITRVGRWLRKYKLDELPQLWNVARGEMSLVGPRPVIPQIAQKYRAEYDLLLEARPGLTDPATLKYYRETEILAVSPDPMRYFLTIVTPDKLRLSAGYLDHATFWSDFSLLMRTAQALGPHIHEVKIVALPDFPLALTPAGAPVSSASVDLFARAQEESGD